MSTHYYVGYASFSDALTDIGAELGGTRYINGGAGVITAAGIYAIYNPGYSQSDYDKTIGADLRSLGANPNNVTFPCDGQ